VKSQPSRRRRPLYFTEVQSKGVLPAFNFRTIAHEPRESIKMSIRVLPDRFQPALRLDVCSHGPPVERCFPHRFRQLPVQVQLGSSGVLGPCEQPSTLAPRHDGCPSGATHFTPGAIVPIREPAPPTPIGFCLLATATIGL